MGVYSTILASVLGCLIIFTEVIRKKRSKPLDILTGVNLLLFLTFVLPPFNIYFFGTEFSTWTFLVNIENGSSMIAILYVIIGYLFIILGYNFSVRWTFVNKLPSNYIQNEKKIEKFAHLTGMIGIFFLIIFIISVGGIEAFFATNTLYRSGAIEVTPLAFVRNLALFIPISCQVFYCLYKFYNKKLLNRYHVSFILYFIASLMLYFNRATRMGLLTFLISFLLINAFYYRKNIVKYLPVMSVIFLFMVIYGKRIYNYFVVEEISFSVGDINILSSIIGQFSFPFYTLTNAIENSFFDGSPRFFFDFVLGILNLLPSAFLPFEIPKSATQLNSDFFSNGVPIDLISLGFYSLGISGVVIITFLFGVFIGMIEKILEDKNNILIIIFYIQFIFFFALRIPYAGPTNVMKSNFCLIIVFLLFIYFFRKKSKQKLVGK